MELQGSLTEARTLVWSGFMWVRCQLPPVDGFGVLSCGTVVLCCSCSLASPGGKHRWVWNAGWFLQEADAETQFSSAQSSLGSNTYGGKEVEASLGRGSPQITAALDWSLLAQQGVPRQRLLVIGGHSGWQRPLYHRLTQPLSQSH